MFDLWKIICYNNAVDAMSKAIKKRASVGHIKNKSGEKKMMWGLMLIFLASAVLFIGGVVMSFRATGQLKRHLTFAGMMF